MLIDCFLFFNEIELLSTRLAYLGSCVDQFIIIESTIDFSGKKREPLLTNRLIEKLPYSYKIKVFVWDPSSFLKDYLFPLANLINYKNGLWKIQHYQRNFILKKLINYPENNLIIFGDLDEFPNKESLMNIEDNLHIRNGGIGGFEQTMYYFDLHHIVEENWKGTSICELKTFKKIKPALIRKNRYKHLTIGNGWHFSYFGSPNTIKEKINAIAKAERLNYALKIDVISIEEKIQEGKDIYSRKNFQIRYCEDVRIPDDLLSYFKMYFCKIF